MNSSVNKVLLRICGKSVIRRSAESFIGFADEMIVVSRPQDRPEICSELMCSSLPFPLRFVDGGITRQGSVLNGLQSVSPASSDIILIHDAARCLVDRQLIERVVLSVAEYGTGIPGIPATSTYKICNDDLFVIRTPDRSNLYEVQTPQGFSAELIISAHERAAEEGLDCTDDAGILEHYHMPVKLVEGSVSNIKLTNRQDLIRARIILQGDDSYMRVGMGFDVHRLVSDRKLILCGVEIPFEFGLLGHSDADVALHALMDAMLGACALGDIGKHFPDSDIKYKNVS